MVVSQMWPWPHTNRYEKFAWLRSAAPKYAQDAGPGGCTCSSASTYGLCDFESGSATRFASHSAHQRPPSTAGSVAAQRWSAAHFHITLCLGPATAVDRHLPPRAAAAATSG